MSMMSHGVAQPQLRARRWRGPAFLRARALLVLIWESFVEGQQMSRAAHKRYPFAEW